MNFSVNVPMWPNPFRYISNIPYDIKDWKEERNKKQQRYQERLAKPISEMKYLDKVVLVDGCTYHVEKHEKKAFHSLESALEYCRAIPIEKAKKVFGHSIRIFIENPKGVDIFNDDRIPPGLLVKDCKDALCVYAKERILTVAADLSEVYTEFYELSNNPGVGHENIFDYGLLYGNYPVYTGKELCLSQLAEPGENVPFVPETTTFLDDPNIPYEHLRDIYMAYHCWYVQMQESGEVYDDGDGGYPWVAIPVSTFVNIGKAGVYWPCWDMIWSGTSQAGIFFRTDEETHDLFRFALLTRKSQELPAGQAYYTMTAECGWADGLLPEDAAGLPLRDSREVLWRHAKERVICASPAFDEVYWESFELQDEAGQTYYFCFDYALLEPNTPTITAGQTCQTTYWNKARWGNSLKDAEVTVCSMPDPEARYSGHGDIMLCCEGCLKDDPASRQKIPVSTLNV